MKADEMKTMKASEILRLAEPSMGNVLCHAGSYN